MFVKQKTTKPLGFPVVLWHYVEWQEVHPAHKNPVVVPVSLSFVLSGKKERAVKWLINLQYYLCQFDLLVVKIENFALICDTLKVEVFVTAK